MSENKYFTCKVLVFSALLKYLSIYFFYLYIYLLNLKGLQRLLIFIKCIFNTQFMALVLCNSVLHNSTLSDRFLNLEIPLKSKGVTHGITGRSVTFFVRKLVQSIAFQNHIFNNIYI